MRLHMGTLLAGVIYLVVGVAFMLETAGLWTLQIADLTLIGPLALVVIGLAVALGSWDRRDQTGR